MFCKTNIVQSGESYFLKVETVRKAEADWSFSPAVQSNETVCLWWWIFEILHLNEVLAT